eukprot:10690505-Alexandrium_andersonii.AAC.1
MLILSEAATGSGTQKVLLSDAKKAHLHAPPAREVCARIGIGARPARLLLSVAPVPLRRSRFSPAMGAVRRRFPGEARV